MNNILKISLIGVAALAFTTASAQSTLQKKQIKKAEATTSVKSKVITAQPSERQESTNTQMIQTQPEQVKQTQVTQPKSPAQMSTKPLQKKTVIRNNNTGATNSAK